MTGKQITLVDDQQWPTAGFSFEIPIRRESAALVVIDVQGYLLGADSNLAGTVRRHNPALQDGFEERAAVMVQNIERLQAAFRKDDRRVVFTRHGNQLPDGSDMVLRRRGRESTAMKSTGNKSGHLPLKGDAGYEIDPRVAPQPGELVLDKNTSSAFHSSSIDLFLRNMEIDTLIMTGAAADQCVLSTAIDAADRGFHVIIATDAVANHDPGCAEATQILFGRVWGYVMTTDTILEWLESGELPQQRRLPA